MALPPILATPVPGAESSSPSPSGQPASAIETSTTVTATTTIDEDDAASSTTSASPSSTSTATSTRTVSDTSETSDTSSDVDEDSSTSATRTTTTSSSSTTTTPSSTSTSSSLTETTDISSSTESETESTKSDSTTEETTKKPASTHTSTSTSSASKTDDLASISPSPTAEPEKDEGGLGTGTIIGIALAGFAVIGILLVVLGTFLKVRRKRIIERETAHLKRASDIWDLADKHDTVQARAAAIERANEKAAMEEGNAGMPARGHSRQDSTDSDDAQSVAESAAMSFGGNAAGPRPGPANAQGRQMPAMMPGAAQYQQHSAGQPGMGGGGYAPLMAIPFAGGMRQPQPAPTAPVQGPAPGSWPGYQNNGPSYGPPHLQRQDSFGERVAHNPPRNMFFPPGPVRSNSDGYPLALPGSSV